MSLSSKKKYNTVVVDPPWDLKMVGKFGRRKNRAEKLPYEAMSLQEIKNFPIKDFANNGAHIYLWTVNRFIRESFEVFDSWGVSFYLMLVGVKPSGVAPSASYVFGTEFCLLGFYGKPMQKFSGKVSLNWFKMFNKAGNHSCKPQVFYNLVSKMSPDPRVDIFNRRVIPSFDGWGDESPKQKQEVLE